MGPSVCSSKQSSVLDGAIILLLISTRRIPALALCLYGAFTLVPPLLCLTFQARFKRCFFESSPSFLC